MGPSDEDSNEVTPVHPHPLGFKEFDRMSAPVSTACLSSHELGLVYVIDDESDIVDILCETLKAAHLSIVTFTHPKKMLEALQRQTPDLVLCDLKMPELSGFDVLKEVKKINAEIPVIFISGYFNTENLLEAISKGVSAAIQKPFDLDHVALVSTNAVRLFKLNQLLSRSFNLFLYPLKDVRDALKLQGELSLVRSLDEELRFLFEQRRKVQEIKETE